MAQALMPANSGTIGNILNSEKFQEHVAQAMPKHVKPERMLRVIASCIRRVPKLAECSKESFIDAVSLLTSWGLEPNGRDAHLVPYGRDCTLILDYKGLVKLAYQSGWVRSIHADVVYSGDNFRYLAGEVVAHEPWDFRPPSDRPETKGEIIAAYVVVKLKGDAVKHEVMTRAEIDGIRARSKAGRSGPWVTDYAEMAKKTVFRRASKWLPLSAEMTDALERDHDAPDFGRSPAPLGTSGVAGLRDALLPRPADDDSNTIDAEPADASGPPTDEDLIASGELEPKRKPGSLLPEEDGDDSYYGEGG